MKIQENLLLEEIMLAINDCFDLSCYNISNSKIEMIFKNGQKFNLSLTEKL